MHGPPRDCGGYFWYSGADILFAFKIKAHSDVGRLDEKKPHKPYARASILRYCLLCSWTDLSLISSGSWHRVVRH
jgi:hypothetical protein